ncbi:hypothetical protein A4D02_35200 [Niastella koreensis]|uniref:DUF1593 domain-containing protein n=2 Tax=Niastella koreensis TaxID=354356 RepID=G8TBR4_NIAKG|nr:nucleoside hydrolase-like domain-containing protein [Niastella koreensis]AEV98196.1 protein of unknown function DUF1593 [Niastella koreensis GR20-10]OQP44305.1 hypothetical protein A4D02_35200 [Niastella koreensis]
MKTCLKIAVCFCLCGITVFTHAQPSGKSARPRVIATSDGEIDDECSFVRFLLYANEWDVEGIVTTSSQYHWHGHKWAGDNWAQPYLEAYARVWPNLVKHDKRYPTAEFLKARTFPGNVETEGEMDAITPGSQHIAKVLLDKSDARPIWLQAWGGTNTIARALKTIEQEHPDRMAEVAAKMRFFLIWEQDSTYQSYIKPHWGKYNILTIISDQFDCIAYRWKTALLTAMHPYFSAPWMKQHILQDHGPLCALYKAHVAGDKDFAEGDFRSEGDSPSFMHEITTGLGDLENPDWGGWAGRYIKVRDNTWLDPVPDPKYVYPEGRWYSKTAWGRMRSGDGATVTTDSNYRHYFEPIWRWAAAFQNDFAARADWCVKSFKEANHAPVVKLTHAAEVKAKPGTTVQLSVKASDPDGNPLTYQWWVYTDPGTYKGNVVIQTPANNKTYVTVPADAVTGQTIHVICEVSDKGSPVLTRYQRVVITVQ